jgi:hypothetical protein
MGRDESGSDHVAGPGMDEDQPQSSLGVTPDCQRVDAPKLYVEQSIAKTKMPTSLSLIRLCNVRLGHRCER